MDASTRAVMQMSQCGRASRMITYPVREAKSMAGLVDLVTNREIEAGSNVLYAHLKGQSALNGYSVLFR